MNVTFDGTICKHSGECVKRLPEVFKVIDGNMVIDTNQETDENIRATVAKCPTGALKCIDEK
ncbi:(4Fe-4S)-binding protein [Porticoccus sp.]|uniref:(4Fe-4S)-binding protein n=1 Tax=Porticoccus sp. TaxID=2024853 RepID=UPI003F6A49F3